MRHLYVTLIHAWTRMHEDTWVVKVPVRALSVHPLGWDPLAHRGGSDEVLCPFHGEEDRSIINAPVNEKVN